MRTKIDVAADKYFRTLAKDFVPYLGAMDDREDQILFSSPLIEVTSVALKCAKKKQILSGMYNLEVVCTFANPGIKRSEDSIVIGYKGVMVKGDASFTSKGKNNSQIIEALSRNSELIALMTSVDLEKGTIRIDDDAITVSVKPLGASYMYMTFPPMNYSGFFHKSDIEKICRSFELIKKSIESSMRAAA